MDCCTDVTNIVYPLLADVYYPTVEQSAYGAVSKTWMLDSSIACSFAVAGLKAKKDIIPNSTVVLDNMLIGRTKRDIRFSVRDSKNAMTNIIITNIRDKNGNVVFVESSGVRAGKPTIYELSTNDPIVGPFGGVEYYKVVIRRSENQAVDV